MKKINTVLFDFDGTVMDTNDVVIQSWQHAFKTLEGKERPEAEIVKTFGEPLTITMEKLLPNVPVEQAVAIYRSYQVNNFLDLIKLFPGIEELLILLRKRNYKTGLVTSRLTGTTYEGLAKYNLEPYFDVIVTCDDCTKHKPDPEPILITLEKLKSAPEEAIMLGDSMFDILCAKNAGVKSVLVGWALAVSEEEKTGIDGPDYMIEKAEDLMAIIES
ncbi:MAG: HAD-IA family hydrolase [Anaerovorax sp.]